MIEVGWLGPVVAAAGGWLVAHVGARTRRAELKASPYERIAEQNSKLWDRLDALETRVDKLESEQDCDRDWITRTITRVIGYDAGLSHLLKPWPEWYDDGHPTY